ncbi:MAG: transketolase [Candidatus Riflebacteria bacterium]|nr:transketolase [Candidatus Riflebacteria bacterium]
MAISLTDRAVRLRLRAIAALHRAGSGHAAGALSMADLLTALFFGEMRLEGEARDRFVLSKGHAAPILYAVFAELGWITQTELLSMRQSGSRLQGHPDRTALPLLDAGTGALGQGASVCLGYALAARLRGSISRNYCVMGDGESQEGQIWEAAMYAPAVGLDNVCFIIDANGYQNEGRTAEILSVAPMGPAWRALGWNVLEIDGHDIPGIQTALRQAREHRGQPSLILARTVKGKGVPFMERGNDWHCRVIDGERYAQAVVCLEAQLSDPSLRLVDESGAGGGM